MKSSKISAQYAVRSAQSLRKVYRTLTTAHCALIYCALILIPSCSESKSEAELDTPTKGKITFCIDNNVQSLAEELVDAFEQSYPDAFLMTQYKSESDIIRDLYNDTTRLAILTRQLNAEETKYFEGLKFGIEQIKIGSDAVVFIVNKQNPDTSFTRATLKKMLTGQDTVWSQISDTSTLGRLDVVFDNGASSNLRYLTDSLMDGGKPGKNVFAVANSDSVIAYVSRTPGAIGVIGLNAIGDKDSEEAMARKNRIKVCAAGLDSSAAWKPSQSAIVTRKYPFVREIWIVKIGKRPGLGTGFASFALGERGQLIVQRAGLAPAAPAERAVELKVY